MWRSRRWQLLLDVIDQLPRNSRYAEAQADDDELAEAFLKAPQSDSKPKVRLSEFGALEERLEVLIDRIGTLISMKTGKAIPARPRPVTAIDRARTRRSREKHAFLVSKLTPHK